MFICIQKCVFQGSFKNNFCLKHCIAKKIPNRTESNDHVFKGLCINYVIYLVFNLDKVFLAFFFSFLKLNSEEIRDNQQS